MGISISGLGSGLDTAQIISDLMTLERQPYIRLETSKKNLQSEKSIFQSINTKLNTLKTAVSDLLLNANFNLVSGKSTNEGVVKLKTAEGASTGNYNIAVTQLAQSHSVKSGEVDTGGTDLLNKTFEITYGGSTIKIETNQLASGSKNAEALEYIKNQINSQNTGLTAAVVSVSDTKKVLVLTSKETGEQNKMVLSGTGGILLGGDALGALGITNVGPKGAGSNTIQDAADAKLTVSGVSITRSSNTISDVIDGVTLELVAAGSSQVTVARDMDKVAEKIDAFVKAYNDVVNTVRNNLSKPADATKMNPLQGDSVLKTISNELYNLFTSATNLTDGYKMMAEIGLEIDKGITKGSLMTGTITFDKEKFKEAFSKDPNAVIDLFKHNENGIMKAMDNRLQEWTSSVNGLITSKIKGYDSEIGMIDDRMEAMDNRLQLKYEQLKKQFTAMEVALSGLKSQQSWLTSQLASLTALTQANKG
ncbi:flagellar filament capping protein FliD [Paenibacillus cisolokensis]|uniref:flagellar filament capping protein FliD n=1 Tax=Paenibacillus cisolokensis TaxID=1658519 RepID=UPI003D2952F1